MRERERERWRKPAKHNQHPWKNEERERDCEKEKGEEGDPRLSSSAKD